MARKEAGTETTESDVKAVLVIQGYIKVIMPLEAACHLFKLIDSIEIMEDKYDSATSKNYQIVRPAETGYFQIQHLNPEHYAIAKMTYAAQQTKGPNA